MADSKGLLEDGPYRSPNLVSWLGSRSRGVMQGKRGEIDALFLEMNPE